MYRYRSGLAALGMIVFAFSRFVSAADVESSPRPVPLTRPGMKSLLEDMKGRTPRIPLPELTAEEKEREAANPREFGYEGRLRTFYLPETNIRGYLYFAGSPPGGYGAGNSRFAMENDPALTLEYRFKTMLFWIASRANNCQYCLGHQESKLLAAGMVEDQLAALDTDWSAFTPAEQAAFTLARRLTLEPHALSDADIESCRAFYTEPQIIEMIMSVAGNNAINRWKEGIGVPQSSNGGNFGGRSNGSAETTGAHSYVTPTSERFAAARTVVAPVLAELGDAVLGRTACERPPLEPPSVVKDRLEQARRRTSRLPIVDEQMAREVLGDAAPDGPLPQWMRLLAQFPIAGARTVASIRAAEETGELSPLLKARMSWVIARQDRAWYALNDAQRRLVELGQSAEAIADLDGEQQSLSEKDRSLLTLARNLAASPVVLTDEQVAKAVELAGPRDVVQAISYVTFRAAFDRFTEAAGLSAEDESGLPE